MKMNNSFESLLNEERSVARKRIVVLTGAGVSAESGVATFRDEGGLWQQYDWQRMASIEGWEEEPAKVLEFYNMRRRDLMEVQPNKAHLLLAELEKHYDVTIITQNIDNLHERAGSTDVLHLHGELRKVTSSANANDPACIQELPLDIPISVGDKAADGSQLRPYIVWFGERVDGIGKAVETVMNADVFVVIGTSLTVQPAASLVRCTKPGIPRFVINPSEMEAPCGTDGYTFIKENATTGMETFIDALMAIDRE